MQNKPNSKTENRINKTAKSWQKINPTCSTIVENPLQIGPILQNKANVKIGKMNISIAIIKDYHNELRTISNECYSKQTQTKPILERTNVNFFATEYYESKPAIRVAGKPTFAVRRIQPERDGKQKVVWMHREIMKAGDGEFYDHINHNGLNNTKANLRLATRSHKAWSRRKAKINSRSKYKRVSWYNPAKRQSVRIQVDGKQKFLRIFADEIEAANAYDRAAGKYFGEFTELNFDKKNNARAGLPSEVRAANCL